MILSRSGLVCWLMAMWLDWDCSCWTSSLVVFFSGGFVLDGPRERSRSRNGCSFSRGRDILLKSLNMLVWVIDLTFLKEYCVIRYIRTLNLSRTIWTVSSVWLWRIKLGGGGSWVFSQFPSIYRCGETKLISLSGLYICFLIKTCRGNLHIHFLECKTPCMGYLIYVWGALWLHFPTDFEFFITKNIDV